MRTIVAVFAVMLLLFGCSGNGVPQEEASSDGVEVSGIEAELPEGEAVGEEEVVAEEGEPLPWELEPDDEVLEKFVLSKLVDGNGGVMDSYGEEAYSAESMGLMMEFAADEGDKELFDRELDFLQVHFLNPEYNLAYKALDNNYQPVDGREEATSVDNFRISRALRDARVEWMEIRYKQLYEVISDAILERLKRDNVLVKEAMWDDGFTLSERVGVADPDWDLMKYLAKRQPAWTIMSVKTLPLVSNCQMDNSLFWQEYDLRENKCVNAEGETMSKTSEMLMAAIRFAEFETYPPATELYFKLKEEYDMKGYISNAFDVRYGIGNGEESIAVYALAGRLAVKTGFCSFAEKMEEKVLTYRVEDKDSELYGLLAKDGEATTFDNLHALILMEEVKNCGPVFVEGQIEPEPME